MTATTAKGVPYPTGSDAADAPTQLANLAAWLDAHAWGGIHTTTQRDLLAGANLWAGIVIWNSTAGRLEVNTSGSAGAGNWAAAQPSLTAAQLLTLLLTVDGSGSGLDADTVDGVQASALATVTALADKAPLASPTFTGTVTLPLANVISPTAAGSSGVRQVTMSTADPSGGADGDVWLKYV